MKKIKSILALTLLFLVLGCGSAMASDWNIEVNGKPLDAEVKIIEGRSLIPLRAVGEALGLQVAWDGEKQAVYLLCTINEISSAATLYVPTATVDMGIMGDTESTEQNVNKYLYYEKGFELEVPPTNIDGRVYVPVRFVCNLFGAPLQVNGTTIEIGDIFTAEKRGDIEGLRKKVALQHMTKEEYLNFIDDFLVASDEYLEAAKAALSFYGNPTDNLLGEDYKEIFATKVNGDIEAAKRKFNSMLVTAEKYEETQVVYSDIIKFITILDGIGEVDFKNTENAHKGSEKILDSVSESLTVINPMVDKFILIGESNGWLK